MKKDCVFCNILKKEYILENEYAFAIFDNYPINKGHSLIIPKRHFEDFFYGTDEEILSVYSLLKEMKILLEKKYNPNGFNIGVNVGKEAGQTIFHLHIHLIPRYKGDIKDPRGGIRGIFPEKRIY